MREIKFRMWNFVKENPAASKMFYDANEVIECLMQQINFDNNQRRGYDHVSDGVSFMQFTGLLHKWKTEVYQDDIFYDEIEHDHGDERLFYVITWINERASFVFLTAQKRKDYDEYGLSAIDRDFEGFYYELDQDSLDKMHPKSNIHQNPDLL